LILAQEQVGLGHRVKVLPLKGKVELFHEFAHAGVEVDLTLLNKGFMTQVYLLRKFLSRNREVICHAHLPRAELVLALTFRVKVLRIGTKHNAERMLPNGNKILSRFLAKFIESRYETIICISKVVFDFLLKSGEMKNTSKYLVVHYGVIVAKERKSINRRPLKESLKIISIARLSPQKNLLHVVETARKLRIIDFDFKWYIFGEGYLRSDLEERIENLQLGDFVKLPGKVDAIDAELAYSDVLVITSNYEGFGLVLLEAMNMGKPIVAPKIPIFREILGEDYTGFYSEDSDGLANKLVSLTKKSELDELGDITWNLRLLFDAKKMVQNTIGVYLTSVEKVRVRRGLKRG